MIKLVVRKARQLTCALVLFAAASCMAPVTHAETLPYDNISVPGRGTLAGAESISLLEHTELAGGEFGVALGFLVPATGTVSVALADLGWPDAFSSLTVMIVKGISVLGSLSGPGEFSFDATSPGRYFALVLGDAQGALDLGLYSLNVKFSSLAAPVPLPAAAWLMISGMGGLAALARRRRTMSMV